MPNVKENKRPISNINTLLCLLTAVFVTWLSFALSIIPNEGFWYLIPFFLTFFLYPTFLQDPVEKYISKFFQIPEVRKICKYIDTTIVKTMNIVIWIILLTIAAIILYLFAGWVGALPPTTIIIVLLLIIISKQSS